MKFRNASLLFWAFWILVSNIASAAQTAVVTSPLAEVRAAPSAEAQILETKEAGAKIRISSRSKNGWFKVLFYKDDKPQYGWIWNAQVSSPVEDPYIDLYRKVPEGSHSRRELLKGSFFTFRFGGLGFGFVPRNLNDAMGIARYRVFWAPGGYADLGFRVTENARIQLRGMYYQTQTTIEKGTIDFDVTHSGIPFLLGLEVDLLKMPFVWDVSVGAYLGMSPQTKFTATASNLNEPNTVSLAEQKAWAGLLNLSYKRWITNWFALVAETGIFYSYGKPRKITSDFNGSGIFKNDDGTFKEYKVSHMGLMFNLGLQFAMF